MFLVYFTAYNPTFACALWVVSSSVCTAMSSCSYHIFSRFSGSFSFADVSLLLEKKPSGFSVDRATRLTPVRFGFARFCAVPKIEYHLLDKVEPQSVIALLDPQSWPCGFRKGLLRHGISQ